MDILVFHACKFIHCNVVSLSNFQNAYIFLHIYLSDTVTVTLAIRFSCLNFCVAFLSYSFCYVYFFTIQLRSPFSYPYHTHPVNTFGAFPCFIIFLLLLPVYALEYGNSIERIFKVCCANRKMLQICVVSIKANT